MDWINFTLFTIGGDTPVLLIDLLTSIVGLTCVFLAGRNSKYNFWVGYLYSLLLLLMFGTRTFTPTCSCSLYLWESMSWGITDGRIPAKTNRVLKIAEL